MESNLVSRFRPLDAALLAVLVPLWVVCFALHINGVARGRLAWVPVFVSASEHPDGYPVVRAFRPGTTTESGELVVGDRIVRLRQSDLRGVGPFGFVARVYEAAGANLQVPIAFVRQNESQDEPHETVLSLIPVLYPWRTLPLTLSFIITGVLALLYEPRSPQARAYFLASVAYSFVWTFFFGGSQGQTHAWAIVFFVSAVCVWPFGLRAAMIFPERATLAGTRTPKWPWLFAIYGPISTSWVFGVPLPPQLGFRAAFIVHVAFILALLFLLARNFRWANPIGRRQLKWIVYGFYIGTAPVLAANIVIAVQPSLWWLHDLSMIANVLPPICICIAILRANAFDIDRLISTTTVYSLLSILLMGGIFLAIPPLAQAVSTATDVPPASGQVALSFLLASLVAPGQRLLRPRIERLFFPERYTFEQGVQQLLQELNSCETPQDLLALVGERLTALLRLESCVMYSRAETRYVPIFVRGSVIPPVLEAESPLVGALQTRTSPVDVEQWQRTARVQLEAADRATLDSLRVVLVLPLSRTEPPTSFVCLGQKRSGDIYTSTELTFLTAIAGKVASEQLHFNEADIQRQAQTTQNALRRYVPEAIATRLVSGQTLEAEEQEISVLFVDIRGYTTYSESRTAREIFSMINRYTETVSQIVRQHGGTIVEFNGDGMMVIFGAPDPLLVKEQAAVRAGRDIVATIQTIALGQEGQDTGQILEVGIGIATGPAFVGNIQSVDRLIWSAIGNTTNLAARLQSLTRELDAAIVIDSPTWTAAGDATTDFQKHAQVPIRGRSQAEDVYLLSRNACAR